MVELDSGTNGVQRAASGAVKLQKFPTGVPELGQPEADEDTVEDWEVTRSMDAASKPKTRLLDVRSSHLVASTDGGEFDPDPGGLVPAELKDMMDKEQLIGMRNVFNTFDSDGDGIVVATDIGALLRKLGLISSRRMIRCIVDAVDVNGDGEIDFGEFVSLMVQVKELSHSSEDESTEGDHTQSPRSIKQKPVRKLTHEQKEALELRQKAMTSFKRAVTIMAFQQMTGTADDMRDQVLKVLETEASLRTEWELQRLLMWLETKELDFIQQLPSTSESDVRIQVCRCLTTKRFIPGQEVIHVGDKGDCMFIVLSGQADVVEEQAAEKPGMPPDLHVIASLEVGKSFGELAIVGDEGDRERSATVMAGGRTPLICGVLTRKDYRNFILKMRMEEMEPVVDMLMHQPTTANIQRSHLLRMALVLESVKFVRHDVICTEGTVSDRVVFLTKGAAEMTVTRPILSKDAKQRHPMATGGKRTIRISTLTVGSAVEMVGEHILLNDKEPSAFTLTATTACEGFVCSRNLAKRYLGKRTEAIRGITRKMKEINDFIAARVASTEEVDGSLSAIFASPGSRRKNKRCDSVTSRDEIGATASGKLRASDYRQPAVFVPDALDVVAAEQSELLHRTHFFSKHPRREYPLHAPNPRYVNTYRSDSLALALAKENGDECESIGMRPVGVNTSAVWRENDMPIKEWLDDPFAEPPVKQLIKQSETADAWNDSQESEITLQPESAPEPEQEPEQEPECELEPAVSPKLPHRTARKRKQQAIPLTPAARYAARDKALGSPRSIAAVRSSLALEHMKGVGTAAECAATARARLQYHHGGNNLPQLYPRDRTMPLPVLGPGSTKAGVMVPTVR